MTFFQSPWGNNVTTDLCYHVRGSLGRGVGVSQFYVSLNNFPNFSNFIIGVPHDRHDCNSTTSLFGSLTCHDCIHLEKPQTQTSNLQVSSLTQVIAHKILESWGYEGFKVHTERVSEFYREKRDVFQAGMLRYLSGYAEWVKPEAGMFFWYVYFLICNFIAHRDLERLSLNVMTLIWALRLDSVALVSTLIPSSPPPIFLRKWSNSSSRFRLDLSTGNNLDTSDSESAIRTTAFEKGVLALPGKVFLPNGNKTAYVRAAFSLSPEEDVYEGLKRLRMAVAEVRGETVWEMMARIFWIWCRNGRMDMNMDTDTGLLEVWNSVRLQISALYLHGFLVKNRYRNMRVTISTRTCELDWSLACAETWPHRRLS